MTADPRQGAWEDSSQAAGDPRSGARREVCPRVQWSPTALCQAELYVSLPLLTPALALEAPRLPPPVLQTQHPGGQPHPVPDPAQLL